MSRFHATQVHDMFGSFFKVNEVEDILHSARKQWPLLLGKINEKSKTITNDSMSIT